MSTNSTWHEADGSLQPSQRHQRHKQPDHEEALDRKMVQHLLARYGRKGLDKMIQEEMGRGPGIQSDGASIISSAAQSSILSDDASSMWDNQSVRTFSSDTSSITGSIISNVSKGAKFLTRRSTSSSNGGSVAAAGQAQVQQPCPFGQPEPQAKTEAATPGSSTTHDNASTPSSSSASKQKSSFKCGFCKEGDIPKTCTRKNDLKRHIEDFHNMNAQWFCRHKGCKMVFDWQAAYKAHLKTAHGGSRMSLDEAKINLCPQVVFACGFEACSTVFEATGDADAEATFKKYVSHLVNHYDDRSDSGEWTYSARIRNLLRQSQVAPAWNESLNWDEAAAADLRWNPQTSGILRKRLESRHVSNAHLIVRYAHALGKNSNDLPHVQDSFTTPTTDTCQEMIPGHDNHTRPMAMHDGPPAPPPAGDFQFKISRGADPQLARYLQAQRRVYVPRQQRPAVPAQLHRPASNHIPSQQHLPPQAHQQQHQQQRGGNLGHFFATMPEVSQQQSPLYMNHQQDNGMTSEFAPDGNAMHQNGMMADDMQSIRNMTGQTPEPNDMDMMDTSSIMDYSVQFDYGVQAETPGMESHHGFR